MINEKEVLDMAQMRQIREGVTQAKKAIDSELARENRADSNPEKDALIGKALAEAQLTKEAWRQASAADIAAMERTLVKSSPKSKSDKGVELSKVKSGRKISVEEAWHRAVDKQQVLDLLKPLAEQGNAAAAAFIEEKTGKPRISAEQAWSRVDEAGKLELIGKLLQRAKQGDKSARDFILRKDQEIKALTKVKSLPAAEKPERPLLYKELPPAKQAELDQLMKRLRVKYHHDRQVGQDRDQHQRQELIQDLEDAKARDVRRFLAQCKLLLGQKFDVRI